MQAKACMAHVASSTAFACRRQKRGVRRLSETLHKLKPMSTLDYGHLLLVPFFLYGAIHYTFSQQMFGKVPRWPLFPLGGYPMSSFSRWLLFRVFSAIALWEAVRGIFSLKPSFLVLVISVLCLVLLGAAYRHDRRLQITDTNVA
jgi:hypothetical protein